MKVRKYFDVSAYNYKDIELKLEKLASQGLIFERFGRMFGIFKKEQPKKLKYTVSCFSEGSIFNPSITPNQQIYIDNAERKGWTLVTNLNQTHVFCTEDENAQPIEDDIQRFNNIKKCMNKNFVLVTILQILVFVLNLSISFNSFRRDPIDVLSDGFQIIAIVLFLSIILFWSVQLVNYFVWYTRSKKSIENGGTFVTTNSKIYRVIKTILLIIMFGSLGLEFSFLIVKSNWFGILFVIIQFVILFVVYLGVINYLRKKKVNAKTNKIISTIVLVTLTFGYIFFGVWYMLKNLPESENTTNYRTVQWQVSNNETQEYRLYSDDIPLKSQDLYGDTNYENYSYKKDVKSTIFLTVNRYYQSSLPAKGSPPEIRYTIIEPKFDFVYNMAKKQMLTIPDYRNDITLKPIDNNIFKTIEAYQEYYDGTKTGKYILFYKDKIIELNLDKPATEQQISIILNKLG